MSEWLISTFGEGGAQAIQVVLALVFIVGLILIAAWLFQRLSGVVPQNREQGKHQRISVMEVRPVDGRRKLVLLRRDNIEHLVLLGGPNDMVVEHHIVRHAPPRTTRKPASRNAAAPATEDQRPTEAPAAAAPNLEPMPVRPAAEAPARAAPVAAATAAATAVAAPEAIALTEQSIEPTRAPTPPIASEPVETRATAETAPLPIESELELSQFTQPEAADPLEQAVRESLEIDQQIAAQPEPAQIVTEAAQPGPTVVEPAPAPVPEPQMVVPAEPSPHAAPEPVSAPVPTPEVEPAMEGAAPAPTPVEAVVEAVQVEAPTAGAAASSDSPKDWLTEFAGELLPENDQSRAANDADVPTIDVSEMTANRQAAQTPPAPAPSADTRIEPTFGPPDAVDNVTELPKTPAEPQITAAPAGESSTVSDDQDDDLIPVIDFTAEKKAHLSARKAEGEDELESEMARLIGELADPKS